MTLLTAILAATLAASIAVVVASTIKLRRHDHAASQMRAMIWTPESIRLFNRVAKDAEREYAKACAKVDREVWRA